MLIHKYLIVRTVSLCFYEENLIFQVQKLIYMKTKFIFLSTEINVYHVVPKDPIFNVRIDFPFYTNNFL